MVHRILIFVLVLLPALVFGSQAMTNLVDAAAAWSCYAAYTNNTLRIEAVDESEWSDGKRKFDRLPFDMPFQLVVGPAAEDRAMAEAALETVTTSMPAQMKAHFEKHHLMAPLLQRMIRRYKPGITNEDQYVTAAAHPNVWRAKDFDLGRLSAAARVLSYGDCPVVVNMVPIYGECREWPIARAVPLVDYPDPRPEECYAVPVGAAVILRALEYRRKFRFAFSGWQVKGRKMEFKCVSKRADTRVASFEGLETQYGINKGFGEVITFCNGAHRRDILVFARCGDGHWGPPSLISISGVPNERRKYDNKRQIYSIDYLKSENLIPALYQNKLWRDVYTIDSLGQLIGFSRLRTGALREEKFSMDGECVMETYASELPKETAKVRYFTPSDDPLTLDYEVLEETVVHPNKPIVPRTRGEFPAWVKRR